MKTTRQQEVDRIETIRNKNLLRIDIFNRMLDGIETLRNYIRLSFINYVKTFERWIKLKQYVATFFFRSYSCRTFF